MTKQKIVIQINRPIPEVFSFTINPENTPLWTNLIYEETNRWPVRKGTTYKNKTKFGSWSRYCLSKYVKNKSFTMSKNDSHYHVRYRFKPIGKGSTQLEYYEWVEKGELEEPFTQQTLEKLKSVIESRR